MSCGVGHSRGLDPVLLWLWHRPAAVALIQPLPWEISYAAGAALKKKKKEKKTNPQFWESPPTPCVECWPKLIICQKETGMKFGKHV